MPPLRTINFTVSEIKTRVVKINLVVNYPTGMMAQPERMERGRVPRKRGREEF